MSADFITSYPSWFAIFCLAAGATYALILYFKNRILDPEPNQKWLLWVMSGIRFIVVAIIAFLLLDPLVRYTRRQIEKPTVVLAIDNSESIIRNADSTWIKTKFIEQIDQLKEDLSDKFEVQEYVFGSVVKAGGKPNFRDKETDIASQIGEIRNAFEGKSLGALILATDGIYNKGSNPYFVANDMKTPVFSIAMGDTTVRSDLLITTVRTNSIAYLGNSFPIVVDISSRKCKPGPISVKVSYNGQTLEERPLTISSDPFSTTQSFMLKASQKGTQQYIISLSNLIGEISYLNNRKDVFIDVIDGRQKILLLAAAPHPDLAALKVALSQNENYELILKMGSEIHSVEELKKYDLVILHQWPANQSQKTFAESLKAQKIPAMYILGRQSNAAMFTNLVGTTVIKGGNNNFNQSTPAFNSNFSLFELSPETRSFAMQLPPLTCPFGKYEIAQPERALFFQKIGSVVSTEALFYLSDIEGYRSGFIAGEGLWRWWLADFEKNRNHNATKEIISKTVQYLALKADKRKFRVFAIQNSFNENEAVVFQAEVFNDNYEPVNNVEVSLDLRNAGGEAFPFTFSRIGEAYRLNAGLMAPGRYSYSAKVLISGKQETISGSLVVKKLQLETQESVANHALLTQMAEATGGKMVDKDSISSLSKFLLSVTSLKPVLYTEKSFKDLINQKWLFFMLVFLFGVEWGIRKWMGAY
jgi:hypothetical protein